MIPGIEIILTIIGFIPFYLLFWLFLRLYNWVLFLICRKTRSKKLLLLGFSTLPNITVLWAGLAFGREENLLSFILSNEFLWLILYLVSLYHNLRFVAFVTEGAKVSVFAWIRNWVGWNFKTQPEIKSREEVNWRTALSASIVFSLADIVSKYLGFFPTANGLAISTNLVGLILVYGSSIYFYKSMNEGISYRSGGKLVKLPKYSVNSRLLITFLFSLVIFLWVKTTTYEVQSKLKIAFEELPNKSDPRLLKITVVNHGDKTRILKEIHVESKTWLSTVYCMSADFDIPVVAQYKVPFHIGTPITKMSVDPMKQFKPNESGIVEIGLIPNATGTCVENWKAKVRVSIVTEDGRRSSTSWFFIKKIQHQD